MTTLRNAISAQIKCLTAELGKLEKMLAQLDVTGEPTPSRGLTLSTAQRKYTRVAHSGEKDLVDAVKLIETAGKNGIKATKLAHEMKRTGGLKPSKLDLVATEKVKMTGKGSGLTYTYVA